jgi:hypothetical protein
VPKPKKVERKIPKFETEDQERQFWATAESTEYVNWRQAQPVRLPNLRPTSRVISIRLPETMIERLKMYVAERIEEELRSAT